MRKPLLLAIVAIAVMGVPAVRADITYQYITDQSSYSASAGQSVTVQLLLQETLSGGSSSLLVSEGGLFGAGVFVTQSGTVPSNPTLIAGPVTPNQSARPDGFGTGGRISLLPATSTTAGVLESVPDFSTPGPAGTQVSPTVRDVFLGSLTLTAGAAGSTTQFTIESYKNFSGKDGNTLTFNNAFDLDLAGGASGAPPFTGADAFTNSFSVNVSPPSASPEPGTLLLTGSAALMFAGGAWRKRRAASKSKVVE